MRHLAVLGLLLVTVQASGADLAQPQHDVLLITIDTLRPDALGWVANRGKTPSIDALARGGARFPMAIAPVPLTQPSHASLLTARWPSRHGVRDNGRVLPRDLPLLTESLAAAGWQTAAFVSGHPLAATFGFDRGFDTYDDAFDRGAMGRRERFADATTELAVAWLQKTSGRRFCWVHYFDPHDPYEPPPAHRLPGVLGSYYGEVAFVDAQISRLLEFWHDLEPPLVILVGDHGESLGHHGEKTHGFYIYDSTVGVPLIVSWPGRIAAGEWQDSVRLVDVAPTILDLLGLDSLPGSDGISFKTLLQGGDWDEEPALIESLRPWASFGWAPLRGIRTDRWKYIEAPIPELYDLRDDPGETRNVFGEQAEIARELATLLASAEPIAPRIAEQATAEDLAALEALGYVQPGAAALVWDRNLTDPKLRMTVWNRLSVSLEALEAGRAEEALLGFQEILKAEPNNPFALSRAGSAALAAGHSQLAAQLLERAREIRPDDNDTLVLLARAQMRLAQWGKAAATWETVIARRPREALFWDGLAVALGRSGDRDGAISALTRRVELEPTARSTAQLGLAEYGRGNLDIAIKWLQNSAKLAAPEEFVHGAALGLMLLEANQSEEAIVWLQSCRDSEGDYARARYELAKLYVARGRLDAAQQSLSEAIKSDPRMHSMAEVDSQLRPLF